MSPPTRPLTWHDWLPLALGLVLALAALEFARTRLVTKLEEAALGQDTKFVLEGGSSQRTLCMDAKDSRECIASFEAAGSLPSVLWLGNSQLPAINRPQPGDRPTPVLLHEAMRARGNYLVTYAVPNANLMEHGLALAALRPHYRPRLLILPVFLDDIREQGVRKGIADLLETAALKSEVERSPIWPHIATHLNRAASEHEAAEAESLQRRFESAFNDQLSQVWPLWAARTSIRGLIAFTIHHGRNKLLGINAQTKRKVDANVYREKIAVLESMLAYAREHRIKVLLYVPPFRLDIPGPYIDADYTLLKADLQALAGRYGAHYANLEDVVPGPDWGNVVDPVYGFEDYDFMHFTGTGHKRHADALDRVLRQIGY